VDCGKVPSTDFIMKELREDIDIWIDQKNRSIFSWNSGSQCPLMVVTATHTHTHTHTQVTGCAGSEVWCRGSEGPKGWLNALTAMSDQAAPPFAIGARANTKATNKVRWTCEFHTQDCTSFKQILLLELILLLHFSCFYFRKIKWLSIISLSYLYFNYNGGVCVYRYTSPYSMCAW
jgi:hypothetical protein